MSHTGCHPERHPVTPSAAVCVDAGLVFSWFYCAVGTGALLGISQLGSQETASHKTKVPHWPGDGEAERERERVIMLFCGCSYFVFFCFHKYLIESTWSLGASICTGVPLCCQYEKEDTSHIGTCFNATVFFQIVLIHLLISSRLSHIKNQEQPVLGLCPHCVQTTFIRSKPNEKRPLHIPPVQPDDEEHQDTLHNVSVSTWKHAAFR